MGIVYLEAMACEAAVVATATGGIPEVVADGETGLLVGYDPARPREFDQALGTAINTVLADPVGAREMGRRGRERAVAEFGWARIAARTVELYEQVLDAG
jgi:starch synthase